MTILGTLRRKRAIKRYTRELPRQLYSDYGASPFFTPGQIFTAARKLKLDPDFIVYGYAMFLTQELFEELPSTAQTSLSYEEARACLLPYSPATGAGNSNFYESGLALYLPLDGGPGGSGF